MAYSLLALFFYLNDFWGVGVDWRQETITHIYNQICTFHLFYVNNFTSEF